jgi:transketolase
MSIFNAMAAQELSIRARVEILKMTSKAGASHVGSALSCVDIITTLYQGVDGLAEPFNADWNRDRFILSKGHATSALYAVLALKNFFPMEWLSEYCADGKELGGHATANKVPGVSLSTGSLGHGMPYGLGIAMGLKKLKSKARVFVLMSDGECDEGTTWETALLASHHMATNLIVIVDRNRLQSLASTEDTLALEPFSEKWKSFGWQVREVDGHNHSDVWQSLAESEKPLCIIANTIKGKGVDFMENSVPWHYKSLNQLELRNAISQVTGKNI